MFYDINVMNSNMLGGVWRAGTRQDMDTSDVFLPKVCSYLSKWMENYEDNRQRNLSLRTSSVFLNGAVRIYKEQLDNLYEDCVRLNEDITLRGRRKISSHEVTSRDDSMAETSRNSKRNNSSSQSRSTSKRRRIAQNSKSFATSDDDESLNIRIDSRSSESINNSDSVGNELYKNKISKEVQTTQSFIFNLKLREQYRRKNANFDKNTPVGLIMVYDTDSRLPNKIICSNLNMDVRKL